MMNTQLLNEALATVGILVGVAIVMAISIVAAAALTQRHQRKAHVREIEQHLAAVAEDRTPAATR